MSTAGSHINAPVDGLRCRLCTSSDGAIRVATLLMERGLQKQLHAQILCTVDSTSGRHNKERESACTGTMRACWSCTAPSCQRWSPSSASGRTVNATLRGERSAPEMSVSERVSLANRVFSGIADQQDCRRRCIPLLVRLQPGLGGPVDPACGAELAWRAHAVVAGDTHLAHARLAYAIPYSAHDSAYINMRCPDVSGAIRVPRFQILDTHCSQTFTIYFYDNLEKLRDSDRTPGPRGRRTCARDKAVREHHKNNKTKTTNGRAARDMTDVYATIVERE